MAVHAESPRFEATEAFQRAKMLRDRFDEALLNNPGFLKAAAEHVLHPRPNSHIMEGQEHTVRWEENGGTRFVVRSTSSRWGKTLRVSVHTGAVGEDIAISILGRNNDQGELRYTKVHVGGAAIDTCQNDPRTISEAEKILNKLTQG